MAPVGRGLTALVRLAPLLLVGCVQIFDLEDPSPADDETPMDDGNGGGSGSGGGSGPGEPSTCPGVVVDARCFARFNVLMDWYDARNFCKGFGWQLAKIESAAVQQAVSTLVSIGEEIYIGANDVMRNGQYHWLDGTPVLFAGWLFTQPDYDINEYCVAMQNAGEVGWLDTTCTDLRHFICEYADGS